MKGKYALAIPILLAVLVLSGCTQPQAPPAGEQQKTCSQLSGYACKENEQCFGQLLPASDVGTCCSVVCTQKSPQDAGIKTCSEQSGAICKAGEKCEGTTLDASDSTACCSTTCAKIEATKEKTLEEMNLIQDDFPVGFVLNDTTSGYQKNALEYQDGNQEAANELLAAGWQENYAVEFLKRSETQEVMGTKIILEDYFASLSRYDKAKDYANYFKKSISEDAPAERAVELSQKFGDNSFFAKRTDSTTISYALFFTKNNIFVNFVAYGQARQITDEKVIEYARKIESRIS